MVSAEQDGMGAPIVEAQWEVVVVEWVVHCHFLMDLPLQMVCSHVDMFLVAPIP